MKHNSFKIFWICSPAAIILGYIGRIEFIIIALCIYLIHFNISKSIGLLSCLCIWGHFYEPRLIKEVQGYVSLVTDKEIQVFSQHGLINLVTKTPAPIGTYIYAQVKKIDFSALPKAIYYPKYQITEYLSFTTQASETMRNILYQGSKKHLSIDSAAIVNALTLGVNELEPELRVNFQKSGLSHLLAISGLHIGLLCGGILSLTRRIFAILEIQQSEYLALLISILIGLLYVFLGGCNLSLIRAWIMFTLIMIGYYIGRITDSIRICGFTATILLLFNPEFCTSLSFIFSFLSTAALITGETILFSYLILIPYMLFFLHQAAIQPFLANLIAVPWVSFIFMPLLVFNWILWSISGFHIFYLIDFCAYILNQIAYYLSFDSIIIGLQPTYGIFFWSIGFFLYLIFKEYKYLIYYGIIWLSSIFYSLYIPFTIFKCNNIYGIWDQYNLYVSQPSSYVVHQWNLAVGSNVPALSINNKTLDIDKSKIWEIDKYIIWFGTDWNNNFNCKNKHLIRVWLNSKPKFQLRENTTEIIAKKALIKVYSKSLVIEFAE